MIMNEDDEYNLIEERWIPCTSMQGGKLQVGLLAVLADAHQLRVIRAQTAIENAAIYRLLLTVLARVFGPASYGEWERIYRNGRFEAQALQTYFSTYKKRFNLFDPQRPFYQAADDRVKPKTPLKMMPHLASGNVATLFDHHTEKQGIALPPDQAVRYLLALQTYGLGGLSGIKEKFTGAPAGRGSPSV